MANLENLFKFQSQRNKPCRKLSGNLSSIDHDDGASLYVAADLARTSCMQDMHTYIMLRS